jgi:hypothetical protein
MREKRNAYTLFGGKLTDRGCFEDNIKNNFKAVGLECVSWTALA